MQKKSERYIRRDIREVIPKIYMDFHTSLSISLFVILYSILNYIKPSLLFEPDGSIREFGIGRKKKTIIPLWLIVLVLAFLSYLGTHVLSQRGLLSM